MNKGFSYLLISSMLLTALTSCGGRNSVPQPTLDEAVVTIDGVREETSTIIVPTTTEQTLTNGLSAVLYEGNYGFDAFLEQGGASSDGEVVNFLAKNLLGGEKLLFETSLFGCSTLSVASTDGEQLFGRNFDWQGCNALIIESRPENGYRSLATVNMDFLSSVGDVLSLLPGDLRSIAALYAPMDGMNEEGLCAAVLMISDGRNIRQNTGKPGLTTTTAIRLLLDKAATVGEAIELLRSYDMNASMGMMVHFALSDASGRSVVVEYVGHEMQVIETPVVTNFYLTPGERYGIGTSQSHIRYDLLIDRLEELPQMEMDDVRDALDSVSKKNFGEFESTEWSAVYNKTTGEIHYYHRENYADRFTFQFK